MILTLSLHLLIEEKITKRKDLIDIEALREKIRDLEVGIEEIRKGKETDKSQIQMTEEMGVIEEAREEMMVTSDLTHHQKIMS